jgi:hypothetical protein
MMNYQRFETLLTGWPCVSYRPSVFIFVLTDRIKKLHQQAFVIGPISTSRAHAPSLFPFARDEDFVGREDVMLKIGQMFVESKSLRRVGLEGLGGVGCALSAIISTMSDLKLVNPEMQSSTRVDCGRSSQRLGYFRCMRRPLHMYRSIAKGISHGQ